MLALLATERLDPRFERYGDFIEVDPVSAKTGKPIYEAGAVSFWGNFLNVSHVFHIITTDTAEIAVLTDAIRANQAREDYIAAKDMPEPFAKLGRRA